MSFLMYVIITAVAGYILKSSLDKKQGQASSRIFNLEMKIHELVERLGRGQTTPPQGPAGGKIPESESALLYDKLANLTDQFNRLMDHLIARYNIKDVRLAASHQPAPAAPPPAAVKPPVGAPIPVAPQKEPALAANVSKEGINPYATLVTPKTAPVAPAAKWDWEKFAGEKLFSWVGGVALFLGALFLVKYSVDKGLIGPVVRVVLGMVGGTAALLTALYLHKKNYTVSSHTLAASGIAILYADIFAAHAVYHYIDAGAAFALMVLITAVAFLSAVRLNSLYVALLALVGGFLTPPLLSTGVDRPFGLFSYVALLNIGLAAILLYRPWTFLMGLAALCTLGMEIGWTAKFFTLEKLDICLAIFTFFPTLFGGFFVLAEKKDLEPKWFERALGILLATSLILPFYLLGFHDVGAHPGRLFLFLFLLDVLSAGLALYRPKLEPLHLAAGALVSVSLLFWTAYSLTPALLPWGLGAYLIFSGLHVLFPMALRKRHPDATPALWGYFYPLIMLVPVMLAVTQSVIPGFFLWPILLLLDGLAIVGAFFAGLIWVMALALLMTMLTMVLWIFHMGETQGLVGILPALAFFSLAFFAGGALVKKIYARRASSDGGSGAASGPAAAWLAQVPALSALLPFFLLAQVIFHLPMASPSPVFGLALILTGLLLGLARHQKEGLLCCLGLAGVSGLEFIWQTVRFDPQNQLITLAWYAGFLGVFFLFPFLFSERLKNERLSWIASAASGPAVFYMLYKAVIPILGPSLIGLAPAVFAVLYFSALYEVVRKPEADAALRKERLALFGGVTLFFVSLIFPLQFEKQWITLGWALEGAALVWFYRRVDHPGLKIWAGGLLTLVFVRLGLNAAVFSYHARSGTVILNWYLYTYGVAATCLFAAAALWRPKEDKFSEVSVRSLLAGGGVILLFLLMNIEIADFFSTGATLTFQFSGSLAQDMSYTLGWFAFGFVLMVTGMAKRLTGARAGGMGLLTVAVGKLFFHDLWRLGELYRVGALVGGAAVLILASFLYQYLKRKEKKDEVAP